VAGDEGLYCDPNDPDDMARTLFTILKKKEIREVMIRRGNEQAKKFSWKKFTEKVLLNI
jgi:glycosyltransferase involved in cell wall biosynthesis